MPDEDGEWLTAAQAAARLGVRPQTLYAYVSRGLLRSRPVPGAGGRVSRYSRPEVDRLAGRARRGGRAGGLELIIDTEITLLDPEGRLYYRGWDVADAARSATYEQVAGWLWTGRLRTGRLGTGRPGEGRSRPWRAPEAALAAGRAAAGALPATATLVDRMRVVCVAVATTDPLRHDRRPEAVAAAGRALVSALVESLPGPPTRSPTVAGRLWERLAGRVPRPEQARALDTALVLLADHELAASTLAARVAASTWADPYLVVETGLGVLGGALHGAASSAVQELLEAAEAEGSAAAAVGARLRAGDHVPGLGHAVYTGADPRAGLLWETARAALPRSGAPARRWRTVEEVAAVSAERGLPSPNVDLALGGLCHAFGWGRDAGEAIFAVARVAGWLAHAGEEYRYRLRFRPRAVYTGPAPDA